MEDDDTTTTIPSDLLTRLLHDFFEDDRTRISADANVLVAKYMETFVKEALARAALENNESGGSRDTFLEVCLYLPMVVGGIELINTAELLILLCY